ncbi:hypothetical protein OUZ56_027826 [Daphnia magna]|uniref:Uncharacterized protein n=1 Tax=Daphnia magna TaxID=35525 RepID=A0ABR0B220_9CRUS|nr:hypothetical protein OUZ56_027826 [Daphnia magna]
MTAPFSHVGSFRAIFSQLLYDVASSLFSSSNFVCIFMAIQMQATGADASSVQFIENGHPIS